MNNATVRNALGKLLALASLVIMPSLHAGSHTWSGAVNGNWSTAGNWSAGGVPAIGEASLTMTFPGSATRTVMTNNIGALTVTSMTFSGSNYIVRGASTITFAPSLINVLCSGNSNTIESTLSLPGNFAVSVGDNKVMAFHTLTGAGSLLQLGEGEIHLRGVANNTLSGGYIVNVGRLVLAKTGLATAVAAPLTIIGTTNFGQLAFVSMAGSDQIAGNVNVIIHSTGGLVLNGHTNTINDLTVMAGSVFNDGLLRLNGDLRLSALDGVFPLPDTSPIIRGNLEFIGAFSTVTVSNLTCEIEANIIENGGPTDINKMGPGTLWLKGGGNFTGLLNIQEGTVRAEQAASFGSVAGTTLVASGASLVLGAGIVTSESFELAGGGVGGQGALQTASGLVTIFGNVFLTGDTSMRVPLAGHQLFLSGIVIGTGGLRKLGEGEMRLLGAGTNTFTGASFVDKGLLNLSKNAGVRAIGSVTVTNGASLVFNNNEVMDNAGILSIHAGGSVNLTNRMESIGGLNLGSDTVLDMGLGTLTTFGTIYAGPPYTTNSNGKATMRGNLSLGGGQRTFSTDSTALYLDCHISDGAGVGSIFQEWDGGSIHLLRSNSFTGPVSLSGFCHVSNAFGFGAPGGGLFSTNTTTGIIVFEHPTIAIGGENVTSWERGIQFRSDGTNAWNGSIALLSNSVYNATYPPDLIFDGAGELAINGVISGPGTVKVSDGTLRLTASNTYSLGHFIGGTLIVQHTNALGVPGLRTYLAGGHRLVLQLPNGGVVTGHTLRPWLPIGGSGGTLEVIGAVSNTWAGPVEMAIFDQTLQVHVPNSSSTLKIDGTISGTGGLEKTGDGSLYLAGAHSNTYSGDTVVTGGNLVLNKPNGVQAVSNTAVNYPASLHWAGSEQIADAATLSLYGGAFIGHTNAYLGSHYETLTDLKLRNSRVTGTTGALTLLGHVDLTHNIVFGSFNQIYATVLLGPGEHQVFSMNSPGSDSSALSLVGSVHETGGSAGLTVLNAGLQLRGSNSFSGPVIVDGSVLSAGLSVHHPHALGSPAQGTFLTNSANLDLAMPSGSVLAGESLVLANHRPGAQQPCALTMYGEFTNTWAGPITLLETNWVQVTFGSKLTVDGPVFGPAILNSIGNGELVLAGAQPNTISGLIMDEGILRLAKPAGVPAFLGDFSLNTDGFDSVPPTLILEASDQFPPQATARLGQGGGTNALLNLNGHAATIRRLLGVGTVAMGAGTLTISNATAQYSDFAGRLQSAPGGLLRHQGIGTQRGGTFALNGATWLQGGTMYFDSGFIDQGLDISAGAVMEMFSPQALFGSLSGAGKLITSSGIIYVGANNASTIFSGVIEGGGNTNLVKIGTGALTLAGTSTHLGKMVVWNGTLLVNGSLAGPVHVERIAPGTLATLGGTGVLQNASIVGLGARLSPGATLNVPSYGKLTAANVAVVDGAIYACEIGGTNAGVNLDQIQSTDTFTLSGVTPTSGVASFTTFGAGVVSNRYAVVKSAVPVSGTFTGMSEGSTFFPSAGRSMSITYAGGASGHDIVLTDLSAIPPGSFSGIQVLTNGHVQLGGTGTPGALYDVEANANLNTTNWFVIGTALANFNGVISFTDTNTVQHPMRFYRFVLP